ncbi:MAG: DUF4344 domain-containing metallopeptidase [Sphingosinicella sp.]
MKRNQTSKALPAFVACSLACSQPLPAAEWSEDAAEFALANATFVLFHEVGHAIVTEFELPVLGREEDAVDGFATVLLVPDVSQGEVDTTVLAGAMSGWFLSSDGIDPSEIAWWGEHGPDRQRAYQIACLLYGSNPETFEPIAEAVALPSERRATCPVDFGTAMRSWESVVGPHMLGDGEAPRHSVTVSYEDAEEFAEERTLLQTSELMESLANDLSGSFRLPRSLTMVATGCGEPNAFWNPEQGRITFCYELLRYYRDLHTRLPRDT